jgi:aqualysin 1
VDTGLTWTRGLEMQAKGWAGVNEGNRGLFLLERTSAGNSRIRPDPQHDGQMTPLDTRMRRLATALSLLAFAACQQDGPVPTDPGTLPSSPRTAAAQQPDAIPGRYIVVLRDGVDPAEFARGRGITTRRIYRSALNGFLASIPEAAVPGLSRAPGIVRIEQDSWLHFDQVSQPAATWGIDRIDQRSLPLDNQYGSTLTGADVTAYIVDSGIRFSHQEFGGRAVLGHDVVYEDALAGDTSIVLDPTQGPGEDCLGHGTHVAGTVGGSTYGVARAVRLVSVRIGGCRNSLTLGHLLAGIDWVTADHRARRAASATASSVANFSLTGGSLTIDDAISVMISSGVSVVAAAGNQGRLAKDLACEVGPARMPAVLTVGATRNDDWRAEFSNHGGCVDLYAPGQDILSALHQGDSDSGLRMGTSFAAPHVTGVAALYLQAFPAASPSQVFTAVLDAATQNAVINGMEPVYSKSGRYQGMTPTYIGSILFNDVNPTPATCVPTKKVRCK